MEFCYVSSEDYSRKEEQLAEIYKNLKTIKGTRSYHAFIPVNNKQMQMKYFSNSVKYDIYNL